MGTKVEPQLKRLLENESDDPVPRMLLALLMDWGCSVDLEDCKSKSIELMQSWQ
jgi:hypothetical protein